jgi:hypothetical protein
LAMICFPAPILGAAAIDGRDVLRAAIDCLPTSVPLLLAAVPYMIGTATLGFLLGARPPESPESVRA